MKKHLKFLCLVMVVWMAQLNTLYGANKRIEQEVYFSAFKEVVDFLGEIGEKKTDAALSRCDVDKIISYVQNQHRETPLSTDARDYLLLAWRNTRTPSTFLTSPDARLS